MRGTAKKVKKEEGNDGTFNRHPPPSFSLFSLRTRVLLFSNPGEKKTWKGKKRSQRKKGEKVTPSAAAVSPPPSLKKENLWHSIYPRFLPRGGKDRGGEEKPALAFFVPYMEKCGLGQKINKCAKMLLLPRTRLCIKQTRPFSTKLDSAPKWFQVASGRICSLRAFDISAESRMCFTWPPENSSMCPKSQSGIIAKWHWTKLEEVQSAGVARERARSIKKRKKKKKKKNR